MAGTLAGRTALITGASRGIGAAIARRFAAEGATIVIAARTIEPRASPTGNTGSLSEVARHIAAAGGTVVPIGCDLGDPASRAALVAHAQGTVGAIDILVNNAATGVFGHAWTAIGKRRYDRLWSVNVEAPFDLMQRLAPGMVERGRGWIVNLGSKTAELPTPPYNRFETGSGVALYGATKAALARLAAGIAAELDGTGVVVNTLAPLSIVWTDAIARTGVEKYRSLPGWIEEPIEGMAEAALALASCDAALTGRSVYSTPFLAELGRPILQLDGTTPLVGWHPTDD